MSDSDVDGNVILENDELDEEVGNSSDSEDSLDDVPIIAPQTRGSATPATGGFASSDAIELARVFSLPTDVANKLAANDVSMKNIALLTKADLQQLVSIGHTASILNIIGNGTTTVTQTGHASNRGSTRTTNKVPNKLPTFDASNYSNFILKFEVQLLSISLDLDQHWFRLMLTVVPTSLIPFLKTIRHLTWVNARNALRCEVEPQGTRALQYQKLRQLKPNSNESTQSYSRRYVNQMVAASVGSSPELVEDFLLTLPANIQQTIRTVRHTNTTSGVVFTPLNRIEDATKLLQSLFTSCGSQGNVSNGSSKSAKTSSNPKKPIADDALTYCKYHKKKVRHTSAQCKLGKRQNNQSSSNANANVTCYSCQQQGHYSNACPNSSRTNNRTSTTNGNGNSRRANATQLNAMHVIQPQQQQQQAQQQQLQQQYVPSPQPVQPVIVRAPNWTGNDAELMMMNISAKSAKTNSIVIPIVINEGILADGLVDTGATKSFINSKYLASLNVNAPTKQEDGAVVLGNDHYIPRNPLVLLQIKCNNFIINHWFETLPTLRHNVILGNDLLPQIGIGITGLPPTRAIPVTFDENFVPQAEITERPIATGERNTIIIALLDWLKANEEISDDAFCNLEGSEIKLILDSTEPIFIRQYPLPRSFYLRIDKQILLWLNQFRIYKLENMHSNFNLPILAVPKPNGGLRVCLDTRELNKRLVETTEYPIPIPRRLFNKLAGAYVISILDLKDSYLQLLVNQHFQKMLVFTWRNIRYCFRGAPFGLKFLTAHFQRVLTQVLQKYFAFVILYIDDIIVFSMSVAEHIQHLKLVIAELTKFNLRLNKNKCHFGYKSIKLLGHIISGDSIQPDPAKLSSVLNMIAPTSSKQVGSILGLASYLREFIPLYSTVLAPLEQLKNAKNFVWTTTHQIAFDKLKLILSSPPILRMPNCDQPFSLATDASQYGVGAVLMQRGDNDVVRFISFFSKSLNSAQRNYPAVKRELLAIVYSIQHYREWLLGNKFTLYTDNKSLTYLLNNTSDNRMVYNWSFILANYSFDVIHLPGSLNNIADSLSRLNKPEIMVLDIQYDSPKNPASALATFVRERLGKVTPPLMERKDILSKFHSLGHESSEMMFKRLFAHGFYWPTMRKDCQNEAITCSSCMKYNIIRRGFHSLSPFAATEPGDIYFADLFSGMNTSLAGYNYVSLVVCAATSFCHLKPLQTKAMREVALHWYSIFCNFGFPSKIISDGGSEFVNSVMVELRTLFNYQQYITAAYNPMANGRAERHVKIAKNLLIKLCDGDFSTWELHVPAVQLAINTRVTRRTNATPFSCMFGRQLNVFRTGGTESIDTDQLLNRSKLMQDALFPGLTTTTSGYNKKMKQKFDSSHVILKDGFPDGARVMLRSDLTHVPVGEEHYSGPFVVAGRQGNRYLLQDSTHKLHPYAVPPQRLKLIAPLEVEEAFEVESILGHRGDANNREYLVRWRGFSSSEDTWEPFQNFNTTGIIKSYWKSKSTTT